MILAAINLHLYIKCATQMSKSSSYLNSIPSINLDQRVAALTPCFCLSSGLYLCLACLRTNTVYIRRNYSGIGTASGMQYFMDCNLNIHVLPCILSISCLHVAFSCKWVYALFYIYIPMHWTNPILYCMRCALVTDWRELEVALDRLVSLEREAITGDCQKVAISCSSVFVHI